MRYCAIMYRAGLGQTSEQGWVRVRQCMQASVRVRACVRACMRLCVRVCVRMRMRACVRACASTLARTHMR